MTIRPVQLVVFALLVFAFASIGQVSPARADGGVLEINRACASAGCFIGDQPGWPVEITREGSYRLTSNLHTGGTTAIEISANSVSLDLAGFVVSPCDEAIPFCFVPGSGDGIRGTTAVDTTIRNGSVQNFRGRGISLGRRARVANVVVRNNEGDGLRVLQNSMVHDSRVAFNAGRGLSLGAGTLWSGNVLTQNSPNFSGSQAVASGENLCEGDPCTRIAGRLRRFYQTSGSVLFDDADASCAAGFRLASAGDLMAEALAYDDTRGRARQGALLSGAWINAGGCTTFDWSPNQPAPPVGELRPYAPVEQAQTCGFTTVPAWCVEE